MPYCQGVDLGGRAWISSRALHVADGVRDTACPGGLSRPCATLASALRCPQGPGMGSVSREEICGAATIPPLGPGSMCGRRGSTRPQDARFPCPPSLLLLAASRQFHPATGQGQQGTYPDTTDGHAAPSAISGILVAQCSVRNPAWRRATAGMGQATRLPAAQLGRGSDAWGSLGTRSVGKGKGMGESVTEGRCT